MADYNRTFSVSTTDELKAALDQAAAGDLVELATGSYGSIDISNRFSDAVTIKSEEGQGATFNDIDFDEASNVTLDSVVVQNQVRADNSDNLTYTNSQFNSGVYYIYSNDISVENSLVQGGTHGVTMNVVDGFTLRDNVIRDARSDLVRVVSTKNGVIENNELNDAKPVDGDHPDAIQFGGWLGETPENIVVRGNHITDDMSTGEVSVGMQGIFIADPGSTPYRDIVIEDNLIHVRSPNSIFVPAGSENVTVANNTLLQNSGGGGYVRIVGDEGSSGSVMVENNVAYDLINDSGDWDSSTNAPNNFWVRKEGAWGWSDLLQDYDSSSGRQWQDFLPKDGTPIEFGSGLGATERLNELLSGDDTTTNSNSVTASDDSISVTEDTSVTFDGAELLQNDSDSDSEGDRLAVTNVGDPSNGTLTDNGDGSFTYTPDADFNGEDSFTYTVVDGTGDSDTGRVSVGVQAAPDAPNAQDDSQSVRSGTTATLDVLANDSDPDGDSLSIVSFEQPANGVLTANDDGTLSYTSDDGFTGTDSFSYTIDDGTGRTDQATMTLEVTDATAPLLERTGLAYDGTTASATVLSHQEAFEVAEGSLELNFTPDTVSGRQGLITKDAKYFGEGGHLAVLIEDGDLVARLQSESATHKLVAEGAVAAGSSNSAVVTFGSGGFKLYTNGTLADESGYTGGISSNSEPVVIGANQWASGDGTSTPLQDAYEGTVGRVGLLDYALSAEDIADRHAATDDGTVNTAPDAVDDSVTTGSDPSATLDPLANDSDPDGDSLSLASFEQPANGSVTANDDGTLTYTADDGFSGTDSFAYTITDGEGGSDSATVQVDVPELPGSMRVFEATGLSFDGGTSSAEVYDHDSAYEVDNGQLVLRFTADDTNGFQALVSKDSRGYDNGGHLTMWLEGDDLVARMQSDSSDHVLSVSDGVTAGQSHDVVLDFGNDGLSLWFDGETVDSESYTGGLTGNAEPIVAGANQWASGDETANRLEDAFNGNIDALALYDGKAADLQTASATEMADLFAF